MLAHVVKGQAGPARMETLTAERAQIAKQISARANQSMGELGPIFQGGA
jgi:2,4-dichlorophenol 6-monooxygenase